mmetsp:Transcript_8775/g.12780  ORF Transcript_8775/g.12780 Transcript_8775/m.12780 type:complete len:513 (-) Transcript_8775:8-1546(-)
MQRNTSFFWLSDSVRHESSDSLNEECATTDNINEELPGLFLDHVGSSSSIGNNQHDITTVSEGRTTERAPLIGPAFRSSYSGGFLPPPGSPNYPTPTGTPPRERRRVTDKKNEQRLVFPYLLKDPSSAGTSPMFRNFQLPKYRMSPLKSIRFQVVIWHIGHFDVCQGQVPMRFRITIFWNDDQHQQQSNVGGRNNSFVWTMDGRKRAILRRPSQKNFEDDVIDVPPISILNAVTFDTMGSAEVVMIDEETRLMRWTCMYNAILFQGDHMKVDQFPHDVHTLKIKIGILALRGPKSRWDRNVYRLDLANEEDSQGSTRVPHGLVLDHVYIPDFIYDRNLLSFEFAPLTFGSDKLTVREGKDQYLQVSLPVQRVSTYYDQSVMPILALLNIVAISCLPRNFASATASTETILSIAFVQVGMRLTIDSRLPNVAYQIKIQKVLNRCFWLLCALAFETNVVFFLVKKKGWKIDTTDYIDLCSAILSLIYTFYILCIYYGGIERIESRYNNENKAFV